MRFICSRCSSKLELLASSDSAWDNGGRTIGDETRLIKTSFNKFLLSFLWVKQEESGSVGLWIWKAPKLLLLLLHEVKALELDMRIRNTREVIVPLSQLSNVNTQHSLFRHTEQKSSRCQALFFIFHLIRAVFEDRSVSCWCKAWIGSWVFFIMSFCRRESVVVLDATVFPFPIVIICRTWRHPNQLTSDQHDP
jgi:hypothetical protein